MESKRLPLLLICDDDSTYHLAVKASLKGKFECRSAYNTDEARAILGNQRFELLLLDIQMRTPDEGLVAIPKLRELDPELSVVMASGTTEFQAVREAMRLGAVDYVPKDAGPDELLHSLNRVIEKRTLLRRQDQQNFEALGYQRQHVLVGASDKIQALRKTIERVRQSPANVVITGETGTGKEVVARQLRRNLADGALAPFVSVDSSTIQSTTAESQLFGHEKGAFTGADKASKGLFEEANGGVIYFDEIANMPLNIQAKLLRVLQEKEVVRLGSTRVLQLEFRVVCATNRKLEELVSQGLFKDDLLQRLNVLPIDLPPLKERTDDIPLLIEHFLKKQPVGTGKLRFTEDAVACLQSYRWPGNIRELGNLISFLVAMTEGLEVDIADLPPKFRDAAAKAAGQTPVAANAGAAGTFYEQVGKFERSILASEYEKSGGNVSKMALNLGMDRSHLYTKLREFGLHQSRPRSET